MEWTYDSRTRCWRLAVGGWEARVERWPTSLEYQAEVSSPAPERRLTRAPHVFPDQAAAQAWCLQVIAVQHTEKRAAN